MGMATATVMQLDADGDAHLAVVSCTAALARALRKKHSEQPVPPLMRQLGAATCPRRPAACPGRPASGAAQVLPLPEPILFPGRWSKPESDGFGSAITAAICNGWQPRGCCREHSAAVVAGEAATVPKPRFPLAPPGETLAAQNDGSSLLTPLSPNLSEAQRLVSQTGEEDPRGLPSAHALSKLGEWARSYDGLWSVGTPDFAAEKDYNRACSQVYPHCAICSLLEHSPSASSKVGYFTAAPVSLPSEGNPLVAEAVFQARSVSDGAEHQSSSCLPSSSASSDSRPTNVDELGRSLLLVCSQCSLCVHASCYGVLFPVPSARAAWQCNRCMHEVTNTVACCLCNLRGGALKPTTSRGWAHIVCVLANVDTFFGNVSTREPIVVNRVPKDRKMLKCVYCSDAFPKGGNGGGCVQCTRTKACVTAFHVTCAKATGKVKFELGGQWPLPLKISCARHAESASDRSKELPAVKVGDVVISRHQKDHCYDSCTVVKVTYIDYCCVHFTDNTISNNLFREDIVEPPPTPDAAGVLQVGMKVNVRWTDGKLYAGKYLGTNNVIEYTVEFGDGSSSTVERGSIYLPNENLPKKVANKLAKSREKSDTSAKENGVALHPRRQTKRARRIYEEEDKVNDD